MTDLHNRTAYCGRSWVGDQSIPGHRPRPSTEVATQFFEYLGEGGENEKHCERCGMFEVAHGEINERTGRPGITDHPFVPRAPLPWDAYYCGCRGWD